MTDLHLKLDHVCDNLGIGMADMPMGIKSWNCYCLKKKLNPEIKLQPHYLLVHSKATTTQIRKQKQKWSVILSPLNVSKQAKLIISTWWPIIYEAYSRKRPHF